MARLATVVTIGLAVIATFAFPAGADAAHRRGTFVLHLPDAGHVTVATIEVKARGVRAGTRAPRNLKVRLLDRQHLPPSVRILTARRRIRAKHVLRYEVLVIAINKAGAGTSAIGTAAAATNSAGIAQAAAGRGDPFNLGDLFMRYLGGAVREHACPLCGSGIPAGDDFCGGCLIYTTEVENADIDGVQLTSLYDSVKSRFSVHGRTTPIFGGDSGEPPPSATLDTGHYDDGHAFGWNVQKPSQEIKVERDIVDEIIEHAPQKIVPQLEGDAGIDLNADGAIGGGSGGQQINTIVGPPTIL